MCGLIRAINKAGGDKMFELPVPAVAGDTDGKSDGKVGVEVDWKVDGNDGAALMAIFDEGCTILCLNLADLW